MINVIIDGKTYEILGVVCIDGLDHPMRARLVDGTGANEGLGEYIYYAFTQNAETHDPLDLVIVGTRDPEETADALGETGSSGYPFEDGERVYQDLDDHLKPLRIDSIGSENIWLVSE